jgi:hypothetical protein
MRFAYLRTTTWELGIVFFQTKIKFDNLPDGVRHFCCEVAKPKESLNYQLFYSACLQLAQWW